MNFKLKFLTFISLRCRRRTKKRIFGRLYFHETGNATHEQQVLIRSQKKWLAVLGPCLVLLALLEERCVFHGGWHSWMRVREREWKPWQALLCISHSGRVAGQVGFRAAARLKILRRHPLAIFLSRNLCSNVKIRTAIQLTSHFFPLKIKDLHEGTGSKTSTPSLSKGKRLRLPCLMMCPINLEIPLTFVSGEERLWVTVPRCSYSGLPNFLFPCFHACEGNGLGLQLRALDLHRAHSCFLNRHTWSPLCRPLS